MFKFEFPSEKAFEDFVWHEIKTKKECPVTGEPVSFAYRQRGLNGYGVTDIIKFFVSPCELSIHVLELKNERIKEAHLAQVARYVTAINRMIAPLRRQKSDTLWIDVTGQVAGPFSPESGDLAYLLGFLSHIDVYDVGASMEHGFHSELVSAGWHASNERKADRREFRKAASKAYRDSVSDFVHERLEKVTELPWEKV